MIGKTFGDYRILEQRGEGGMGMFYRAVDQRLDRIVGLKTLRAELLDDPDVLARLETEAKSLARLDHPNIARLLHYLVAEGQHFIVMEYVDGPDLAEKVRREGLLSIETVTGTIHQICAAIGYAHARSIIHRDLKPSNILLTAEGMVKVTDFGIAKILGVSARTRTGMAAGSLPYMAPEQIRGSGADTRTDIYQLGVTLFELLTGSRPFAGATEYEMMTLHLEAPPPRPSSLNGRLGSAIDEVVLKTLAKAPEERFQTAAELDEAVQRALGSGVSRRMATVPATVDKDRRESEAVTAIGEPPTRYSPARPATPAPRPTPTPWRWIAPVSVAAVAAAVALVVWMSRSQAPSPQIEPASLADTVAPAATAQQSVSPPDTSARLAAENPPHEVAGEPTTEPKPTARHDVPEESPGTVAATGNPQRETAAQPTTKQTNLILDIQPFSMRDRIRALWLDGRILRGTLPAEVHAQPGLHTVRWQVGTERFTDTVTVAADGVAQRSLFVETGRGRLNVAAQFVGPDGFADIYLDGVNTGVGTPGELRGISAGPHEIELRREGYRMPGQPAIVRVRVNERTQLTLEMIPE